MSEQNDSKCTDILDDPEFAFFFKHDEVPLSVNDFKFPTPDHLIMEIKTKLFYSVYNVFEDTKCVEMLNFQNGQLVLIDLNTNMYQISHINDPETKSDFIKLDFNNKDEVRLYNRARCAIGDGRKKCRCSIS